MEAHHETQLKNHLNDLDDETLENVKAHADAAEHDEHPSFHEIVNWLRTYVGIPVLTVGGAWKAIKMIKRH